MATARNTRTQRKEAHAAGEQLVLRRQEELGACTKREGKGDEQGSTAHQRNRGKQADALQLERFELMLMLRIGGRPGAQVHMRILSNIG